MKFITNTYIISDTYKNTYINISIFHFIIIINIIIFIKIFITFSYNLYSLTKALIDLSQNLLLKSSFLSLQKLLKSLENLFLFSIPVKRLTLISELLLKTQSLVSLKSERKSIILLFLTLSFSKITLKRLRKLLKS